jgi:radical SAM superfamily enzyme YgiQ (UPF0313 family)
MRVLIVSTNRLKSPAPAFPSGPAYVAGAAIEAGHEVEVFDCCFAEDVAGGLDEAVKRFRPDVIGISIRNALTGRMMNQKDLRGEIKEIVDGIKGLSSAPIVLGGPAFNIFGREWLEYLELDYGIRGEAEFTFPLYLDNLEKGGDVRDIPGCVFRDDGEIHEIPRQAIEDLDATPYAAFELFDLDAYMNLGTFPSIFTQRGCSFRCSYCPVSEMEGTRYRLKSPGRVADEIERVQKTSGFDMFFLCDNVFNFPPGHAEGICEEFKRRRMGIKWTTLSLTPLALSEDLCRLMKETGCMLPCLCVETGSSLMLENLHRGYTKKHIEEAMINLDKVGLPFSITLMFGGPGETPETVSETLGLLDGLPKARLAYITIGFYLEHHQSMLEDARRDGQLKDDGDLFKGAYYMSPHLSKEYLEDLAGSLAARDDWYVN